MNIVYALTNNYYDRLLPSVRSLLEHNKNVRLFIVCEDDEFPLDLPCDVVTINVKDQTTFLPTSVNYRNIFTYINLLKVCYPSLMHVNKVIHLDVDTIITDSLEPLWKTDIKGKWFAAVPEEHGRYKPFGDKYYNMGVALINLLQMRKDKIEPVLIDYLNTVSQPWADQDAWNKYGLEQDKIVPLDIRYNENQMTGTTDNPAIIHFCAISDWYTNPHIERRKYLDKYL